MWECARYVRVWICKFATLLTAIHASFALSLLKTNLLVALLFLRLQLSSLSLSPFSIHWAGQLIWQRLLLLLLLYLSLSLPSLYLPPPAILVATLMCCLSNQRVTDAVPVFPKKKLPPPLPPNLSCCRLLAVTRLTKLRSSARDSAWSRGREGEGRWLSGVMLYGMFDQSFWYSGIFE